MRYTSRGLLVVLLGLLADASARSDELTTTGGKKVTGTLTLVDAQGVTFKTSTGDMRVAAKDIVLVELAPPPAPPAGQYNEFELNDGSTLRCGKFLLKGKIFEVELLPGPNGVTPPSLELPMSAVFTVLRRAEDAKNREQWRQLLLSRGKKDLYVQRQATGYNVIQGRLLEGDAEGKQLTFEREDGTKTPLLLSRATGGLVLTHPQAVNAPRLLCRVADAFGNTWFAAGVELAGGKIKVTTVSGVVVEFPNRAGVSRLDYAEGNVSYLADMSPRIIAPEVSPGDLKPTAGRADMVRGNDQPLKLDGVPVQKSVLVSTPYDEVILTYTLTGDFREFRATAGCPDTVRSAPQNAGVKLTVEADGRTLFSEEIKFGEKPKGLVLDVKGTRTLKLTVQPLTADQCNQLILAEARVQK